jgi:hypothetical protein
MPYPPTMLRDPHVPCLESGGRFDLCACEIILPDLSYLSVKYFEYRFFIPSVVPLAAEFSEDDSEFFRSIAWKSSSSSSVCARGGGGVVDRKNGISLFPRSLTQRKSHPFFTTTP